MSTDRQDPGKAGSETARQITSAQAAAGMDADRIAEHHQDVAASLLCGAETPDGQAFARAYDGTGETLISELREMERGRSQTGRRALRTLTRGSPRTAGGPARTGSTCGARRRPRPGTPRPRDGPRSRHPCALRLRA